MYINIYTNVHTCGSLAALIGEGSFRLVAVSVLAYGQLSIIIPVCLA